MANSKFDSVFLYPTDGEAVMELRCDDECFAEIRISTGELVFDFVPESDVRGVPAGWIQSQIELALTRAKDSQGNIHSFKMHLPKGII